MKKIVKHLIIWTTLCVLLFNLSGCFVKDIVDTPLSEEYVRACFARDEEDLNTIKNYMMSSGYTVFSVCEDYKTAFTEFKEVTIKDEKVLVALEHLKEHGYTRIYKNGETIEFRMWTGLQEGECGIAFVQEETDNTISYIKKIRSITHEWYYYFSNYRIRQK